MIGPELTKIKLWTIANLLVFFASLVVNYLGASGYFNGMGQAEVSKKYPTLITPSGFAFSIWGVIYGLLLATLIYFFAQRNDLEVGRLIQLVSGLFILASLFNMGWIIAFSYEKLGLSTILIFGLLISLMVIIERIYMGRASFPYTLAGTAFTLYASWVFIASILNVSLLLVQKSWEGFGVSSSVWTIIILFIAISFVLFYVFIYQNAVFPIALAWAFFGIYSSYKNGIIESPLDHSIKAILLLGMVIFIALTLYTFVGNGYSIFPRVS